jgi:hypothetical protein
MLIILRGSQCSMRYLLSRVAILAEPQSQRGPQPVHRLWPLRRGSPITPIAQPSPACRGASL